MPISRDGLRGYELQDRVGRGGFATVYRAVDLAHDREVAIKVLDSSMSDADRRKFDRERRAIGRLADHPHVVPVLESGYTDEGEAYLVLEFAPGGSMADRIDSGGPLPWTEALEVVDQIADAVERSHGHGILHCDIKPENILLSAYGAPKLTDFGIARRSATETASPQALSLAHAPPESLQSGMPTELVDVYALASTFHQLVAGAAPFQSADESTMAAYALRIATAPPPSLAPHGVPAEVDRVIKWAMAKQADQRPQSVAAFRQALQTASAGREVAASTPAAETVVDPARAAAAPATVAATNSMPPAAPPDLRPSGTGRSRLPVLAGFGALLAVVALAIGGFVLLNDATDLTSGEASWWELVAGDCTDVRFDVGTISTVPRRPCEAAHDSEATGVVEIPAAGGPFPGIPELRGFANSACQARFVEHVGTEIVETELAASFVFPDESQWNAGVEQVLCLARRWDEGSLPAPVFDAADEPHVRVDVGDLMPLARLDVGTCLAVPDGGGLAVPAPQGLRGQRVTVENCATAHGGEIVGLAADLLIGPASGEHDLDTLLTEARTFCSAELTRYAGETRNETVSVVVPDAQEWDSGGRGVACLVLWDPPNTGSLAP